MASYISSYTRFLKRDRRKQASKPTFRNSTNHFLAKAFLAPITATVTRWNWRGHHSRSTTHKRILPTPAGCSPHGIFSDSSGNDSLPLSWKEGQEWSTGHSNIGIASDLVHLSRGAKDTLLFTPRLPR